MSRITVYTTVPCSFCDRVKGLLKARGLQFAEVQAAAESGRLDELLAA